MNDTMREAFARTATRLLDEDPRAAVVLADISAGLLDGAATRHPDRVLNVGIREQLMVGVAGGLALSGMRPIVHSYAPFLVERAYEQVKLDLVHQDVPAVLVGIGGSYDVASAGRTHHAPGDVGLLDMLAGVTIQVPGHPADVEPLLRRAMEGGGRTYLRLSEQRNGGPSAGASPAMHVLRRGSRGTVIAVGPMLDRTLHAVEGMDVTVLHAVTVRPFDSATLLSTLGTPAVVVVEPYLAGTSDRPVTEALAHIPHRLLGLGVGRRELRRYGTAAEHDAAHGLDPAGLRRSVATFLDVARVSTLPPVRR